MQFDDNRGGVGWSRFSARDPHGTLGVESRLIPARAAPSRIRALCGREIDARLDRPRLQRRRRWMGCTLPLGLIAASLSLALNANTVNADSVCTPNAGRFVSIQGAVEVQAAGGADWRGTNLEDSLCEGDTIRVGTQSRAAVALINDAVLRIDENTTMRLVNVTGAATERSWLDVVQGTIMSFSRKPRLLEVSTPYLNGSIEGTEFVVRVGEDETQLTVFEGTVVTSNDRGSLTVSDGATAVAKKGESPQPRTLVRPRDAVQWSLYYPPVIALGVAAGTSVSPALRQAADLLAVGRVEAAQAGVEAAIADGSDAGLAYALRAVIKVTQNDRTSALADARKAVGLTDAAAAGIALSYVQQADFQIEDARDTLRKVVDRHPNDALARARLAELELMLGRRDEALAAAQAADAMAPNLSRTKLVLGFNALALFRNAEARSAFERAVAMDSADPLGHLGLGLAKISNGELEEGRRDLEAAVALDSNSALLRAYLGKAYFEERRGPLDAQQYALAKELDPLDPTAYLYDGILKQTINRPVEAVADLERSIELNDNRAVFRGRLLLDEDRAARGTSLARAYNDLGFKQLGVNEATKSLSVDPSNASAHRFLADSYLGTRRTDIARVSEMLQTQLLQDVNLDPIQPSLAVTNLNIATGGGPGSVGFNEFTPLFQQNQVKASVSSLAGNNDTFGAEGVVSAVYRGFSLSAGAFTYNTDGWRPNNGLEEDIYSFFAQWAISSKINVQAEYRRRETKEGDLAFNFDPDAYLEDKTTTRDQETWRLGARFSPSLSSDVLISYIHNKRDETQSLSEPLDPFVSVFFDNGLDEKGDQLEGQYIFRHERFNLIGGLAYSKTDVDETVDVSFVDVEFGPLFGFTSDDMYERKSAKAYLYAGINMLPGIEWTIGLSYDDYDDEASVEETSFNPKLGVRWAPTENLVFRAAAFKTLKPALVDNRTLEPTQIAGFNQFFDDINATKAWRYGAGVDWRINPRLAVGAEATWRDLEEPVLSFDSEIGESSQVFEDRDEQLHRIYLYWAATERIGVSADIVYDLFKAEKGDVTEFGNLPERVRTFSIPVVASYFHPSGFFGAVGGTFVDQEVERSEFATYGQGQDSFFLVDAAVGYRFPKRRGQLSVGVKNLFDTDFYYQDDSFRETSVEASTGPYFPDRTVMGTLTLSF
jgi:tetratricopeptide (TPR) repeat protein